MADYKIINKRQADGSYVLACGWGKQKRTAPMVKDADGWRAGEGDDAVGPFGTMREAKEAWGARVKRGVYIPGDSGVPPKPVPPIPPVPRSRPKRSGPPTHTRKTGPKSLELEYQHNPFDGRFRCPETRQITPVGLLIEIERWVRRYEDRIAKINTKLAETRPPEWNPFDVLIADVRTVIARECPDLVVAGTLRTPAEIATQKRQEKIAEAQRRTPASPTRINFEDDDIPF